MRPAQYPEIEPGESFSANSMTQLPTPFGAMSGSYRVSRTITCRAVGLGPCCQRCGNGLEQVVMMERKMGLWVMGTEGFEAAIDACGLSRNGRPVRMQREQVVS